MGIGRWESTLAGDGAERAIVRFMVPERAERIFLLPECGVEDYCCGGYWGFLLAGHGHPGGGFEGYTPERFLGEVDEAGC